MGKKTGETTQAKTSGTRKPGDSHFIPGEYQTEIVGQMHHDASIIPDIPKIPFDPGRVISPAEAGSLGLGYHDLSSDMGPAVLVEETPRYFMSAVFTFYSGGYRSIVVSGIRRLEPEDLDNIQDAVVRLFEKEIEAAGEDEQRKLWSGLPEKYTFILQQINRL